MIGQVRVVRLREHGSDWLLQAFLSCPMGNPDPGHRAPHAVPSPNPSVGTDGKANSSVPWKMLRCCCQLLLSRSLRQSPASFC